MSFEREEKDIQMRREKESAFAKREREREKRRERREARNVSTGRQNPFFTLCDLEKKRKENYFVYL